MYTGRVPIDATTSQAWTEVAQGTRLSWHMFVNVPAPTEGSNFARTREVYPFELVDERVRAYVGAALEHLSMWADYAAPLKFHAEHESNFQQRPPYTLARAALEAAAQAVWMLDTSDVAECLRRHVSLIRWDLREHARSKANTDGKRELQERERELVGRVSAVFSDADVQPPPGYLWIVRQACAARELRLDADSVERLWRAASGSAHGMYWPTQELQKMVELRSEDGQARQIQVADPDGITEVLQAAYTMTQYAVLKYAAFAGADLGELIRASGTWLAGKITLVEGADQVDLERFRQRFEAPSNWLARSDRPPPPN
jgi:hypothetical protein